MRRFDTPYNISDQGGVAKWLNIDTVAKWFHTCSTIPDLMATLSTTIPGLFSVSFHFLMAAYEHFTVEIFNSTVTLFGNFSQCYSIVEDYYHKVFIGTIVH